MLSFALLKQSFYYQIASAGQYSEGEIVSSHQTLLARPDHMREFTKNYTYNTRVYCKQEIGWRHLLPFTHWFYLLSVNVGFYIGYVSEWSNPDAKKDKLPIALASFAVTCQYHVDWLNIDCTYVLPFYRNKEWGKLHEQKSI